jgi:ankyrin repeat protein
MSDENIFNAARDGIIEDVKRLVKENGVDVNSKDESGRTPLHHVAKFSWRGNKNIPNAIQIIRFLVSEGANVNAENKDGETPLHEAVKGSHELEEIPKVLEITEFLLSVGADINAECNNGYTPLNYAMYNNGLGTKTKILYYLESKGATWGSSRKKGGRSGCYIATAIYGSYDCPQVWALRRYRDNSLTNNILGRVFINIYYSTSPTIVKIFGKTDWFIKFCRSRLDKFIYKLKKNGFEDTPYND